MQTFQAVEGFDRDQGNISKNWERHKVTPAQCEELFFHMPLVVQMAEQHSASEKRYFALGKTDAGRRLFIVFTVRKNKIRVISARDMSRKERSVYHEKERSETDAEIQE
jgi:uncharacterized DUF497 family protein